MKRFNEIMICYDNVLGATSASLSDRMTMAIELAIRKASPKMSKKDAMQVIQGTYCTPSYLCVRAHAHKHFFI